jgi:oxygen-independent coproporphyrinogen-3 oxidase
MGGGTPSLLADDALAAILAHIKQTWGIAPGAEVTLEANPDDVTPQRLAAWLRLGINRLSLGVQSFDDSELRFLGRTHNAQAAKEAVLAAADAGFEALSLDLIYALPNAQPDTWAQTLKTALDLPIQHLSAYGLTIEGRTLFQRQLERGQLRPAPDEAFAAQYWHLLEATAARGFSHYEVSSFGKPDHEARHNSNYWRQRPYLGLGPAAHSYRTPRFPNQGRTRFSNVPNVHEYTRALQNGNLAVSMTEQLTPAEHQQELLMTGLRSTIGVTLAQLNSPWNQPSAWEAWVSAGLLRWLDAERSQIAPTDRGMLLSDWLLSQVEI